MARKTRGDQAWREYQLAQVNAKIGTGASALGSPLVVTGIPAKRRTLTYASTLDQYFAHYNKDYAEAVYYSLRKQSENLAKVKKIGVDAASHETLKAYNECVGQSDRALAIYMMAYAKKAGLSFHTHLEGVKVIQGVSTRAVGTKFFCGDTTRENFVWAVWTGLITALSAHKDCVPDPFNGQMMPGEQILTAIDFGWEHDAHVAPCRYLRLVQQASRRGVSLETLKALLQTFGTERLDDMTQLLMDEQLSEQVARELLAESSLVHSLSSRALEELVRSHKTRGAGQKMSRHGWLMRRTLAKLTKGNGTQSEEAKRYDSFKASLEYDEKGGKKKSIVIRHGKTCAEGTSHRPGQFEPLPEEAIRVAELPDALKEGLQTRLQLEEEALLEQADRVLLLFGENENPEDVLFAFDLFAGLNAEVSAKTCLDLARSTRKARIPHSLAFDVVEKIGGEKAPVVARLIDENLLGVREVNALLRAPHTIDLVKDDLEGFLRSYKDAQSPTDIYSFAIRSLTNSSISPR